MELISTKIQRNYTANKSEIIELKTNCSFQTLRGDRFFIKDGDLFSEQNNSAHRQNLDSLPDQLFRLQIIEDVINDIA